MAFIQMSVPLVFWGQRPPSHEITCFCRSEEKKAFATGSSSGQVCLWDICVERKTESLKVRPRCMLFGGGCAICSLCFVRNWTGDTHKIASLSEDGLVTLWDGKDGACLKYTRIAGKHSGLQCLPRSRHQDSLIICYGQYSNVFILDSNTLETLCVLKACYHPNWITQTCFLSNVERRDALLALTVDGVAKLWLLPPRSEMKDSEEIYEEKSKTLGISTPLSLASCSNGLHTTALIVCRESWQVFDATGGRMKLLMIHACEASVAGWSRGDFLDCKTVVLWTKEDSRAFVYKLSPRCIPGLQEDDAGENPDMGSTAGCCIQRVLGLGPAHQGSSRGLPAYLDSYWHLLGDRSGRVYLWDIRRIVGSEHEQQVDPMQPTPPETSCSIAESWEPPALPCGLTDMLYHGNEAPPTITCSLFLSSFGRLVCGQADGSIVVLSAVQAASVLMLQPRRFSRGWPQHCVMRGHRGSVTCLLYPSNHSRAYDKDFIMSGGSDFTVRMWDLFAGVLIHTFTVHGGAVRSLVSCPPDINPRLQTCVCSVAVDSSVAILSATERKCLLVAACHTSPIRSILWRLEEDFLLVNTVDGKLYVWQIETGTLDRCVDGETAQTVLDNTPAPQAKAPHLTHQGTYGAVCVESVRAGVGDSLIQVLLFDPQVLINRLLKMQKPEEPKEKPTKQVEAFRTYLYARKHFGVEPASQSPPHVSSQGMVGSNREQERAREVLGKAVASSKAEQVQVELPGSIIDAVRLLVSCLHAWSLDQALDQSCEACLGLVHPLRPVSFGLLSKGGRLSLVLPGWGLQASRRALERLESLCLSDLTAEDSLSSSPTGDTPRPPQTSVLPDQRYHIRWQLSCSLTTQHLLTVVSITNTLMNQSAGAHALAMGSGVWRSAPPGYASDSEDSDGEEAENVRENQVRAVWSQVAALHCVMLPERMEGKFRAPHLPVLASRFLDHCQAIREAAQALLQAELRRSGVEGRRLLVSQWAGRLQPRAAVGRGLSRGSSEDSESPGAGLVGGGSPTQQQQATALVILGMIGAEFSSGGDKMASVKRLGRRAEEVEIMDPAVARQTAKTLQSVLLEKPSPRSALCSNLRCSAVELVGRGFHLWEKHIDAAQVVVGLLDLAIQPSLYHSSKEEGPRKTHSQRLLRFTAETAHRALNLMVLLRPVTMVITLAKEVALFLGSQHVAHYPHSSLPPIQVGVTPPPSTSGIVTPGSQLLPAAKGEILELMRAVVDRCAQQISVQLLEVVDVVLFALDQEQLKRKSLHEIFPALARIPNLSLLVKTRRLLAAGARSGQVCLYDLKQGRTQMLNAHSHSVTALAFSDDGKMLATYSYGDSTLSAWQISHNLFGIMQTPKLVNSWPAISSSVPGGMHGNFATLDWSGHRSITLHIGEVECKYSI